MIRIAITACLISIMADASLAQIRIKHAGDQPDLDQILQRLMEENPRLLQAGQRGPAGYLYYSTRHRKILVGFPKERPDWDVVAETLPARENARFQAKKAIDGIAKVCELNETQIDKLHAAVLVGERQLLQKIRRCAERALETPHADRDNRRKLQERTAELSDELRQKPFDRESMLYKVLPKVLTPEQNFKLCRYHLSHLLYYVFQEIEMTDEQQQKLYRALSETTKHPLELDDYRKQLKLLKEIDQQKLLAFLSADQVNQMTPRWRDP